MKLFDKDPTEQFDPFGKDPTKKPIEDPTKGAVTSQEFKHAKEPPDAPISGGRAALWQEHTFDNKKDESWVPGYIMELARFVAPPGTQGRVSIIETSILNFRTSAPNTNAPYSPFYYDFIDGFATVPAFEFYLRLDSWPREGLGAPLDLVDINLLPGVPHPQLGNWPDARYDYARFNNHVSLFVPEAFVLRMFCQVNMPAAGGIEHLSRIYGRLAGVTQHWRGNPEALIESRKWPG